MKSKRSKLTLIKSIRNMMLMSHFNDSTEWNFIMNFSEVFAN